MGILSPRIGGLTDKLGTRRMLTGGPLAVAAGLALMGLSADGEDFSYWTDILPGLLVLAFGMAFSVAPLTTAVVNAVDDDYAGIASGVNNAVSRTAGLIATALIGFVLADGAGAERLAGFSVAAYVGAALSVAAALSILFLVREDAVSED